VKEILELMGDYEYMYKECLQCLMTKNNLMFRIGDVIGIYHQTILVELCYVLSLCVKWVFLLYYFFVCVWLIVCEQWLLLLCHLFSISRYAKGGHGRDWVIGILHGPIYVDTSFFKYVFSFMARREVEAIIGRTFSICTST
jgi:hypothetical protein